MNNIINKTVEKYNMLSSGDRVLVACSGGADSMLLLNYLISVSCKYNLIVEVAHIEHGIRGEESLADAQFVKDFCSANDIKFHLLSIDAVSESATANMGVEEYSRKRRYEFFDTIECDKIATAHNMNDNVETLLFRLARGTGLKGACAIQPVRGKIIRPLIELTSAEIREYCNTHNIQYRVDSTNSDNSYTRNFIRNVVVPELESVNPKFTENASQLINALNENEQFVESYSDEAYCKIFCDNKLKLNVLKSYPTAIVKRVLVRYFEGYGILLDKAHIESVMALLSKTGREQLKGELFAVSDGEFIRCASFCKREREFTFVTEILKKNEFISDNIDFYCDYDKIIGDISVRARMSGDTIKPNKRGCTKSLKKLYNEYKIPEELRQSVGVITDNLGVIGIIGYCVDERVAVTDRTNNILSLKLLSED